MAETIGKITKIKVMSFLPGTVNAFDIANITVKETGTGQTWLFHLWQSRDDDTARASRRRKSAAGAGARGGFPQADCACLRAA